MPNKVYQHDETAITWLDTGGTELFTGTSVSSGAGRQGALHDFGTSARAERYAWRAYCQFATTPVVGEVVQIYWKSSDGTHPDNDDGTGDIAVSAQDKLRNLEFLGNIVVDEAATGVKMVASGEINVPHRHGAPVFWNATADALSSTASHHGFVLTPIPMELQ